MKELRGFYELIIAKGGIPLEHCTLTDDGNACAIEYNVIRWGDSEIPAQAGVSVYERGRNGLLTAARIYDDRGTAEGPHGALGGRGTSPALVASLGKLDRLFHSSHRRLDRLRVTHGCRAWPQSKPVRGPCDS
jgi:hypothetical protein